jgi:hypothetical protein
MKSEMKTEPEIATSSVEDGLDFACSLIVDTIIAYSEAHPERAKEMLRILASYVRLRYVGETGLALEYLTDIGTEVKGGLHFARQIEWIEQQMGRVPNHKKPNNEGSSGRNTAAKP